MALDNSIIVSFGILLGIYLFYKILMGKKIEKKPEQDFDQLYNKVLTSDEYKVKGQYDK